MKIKSLMNLSNYSDSAISMMVSTMVGTPFNDIDGIRIGEIVGVNSTEDSKIFEIVIETDEDVKF